MGDHLDRESGKDNADNPRLRDTYTFYSAPCVWIEGIGCVWFGCSWNSVFVFNVNAICSDASLKVHSYICKVFPLMLVYDFQWYAPVDRYKITALIGANKVAGTGPCACPSHIVCPVVSAHTTVHISRKENA